VRSRSLLPASFSFISRGVGGVVEVGKRAIGNYFEHRMGTYAALAYRGPFALFPFMLLLVVLVGVFGPLTQSTGSLQRPRRSHPSRSRNNWSLWSSSEGSRSNRSKKWPGGPRGGPKVASAPLRRGRRAVVRLSPLEYARQCLQQRPRSDRKASLVEGAGALFSVRSPSRAR
jgi:hypothetical protein